MTPKILMVTGDAAESLEVLYPYQRLREEGYEVHIVAPTRKQLRFGADDFEPGFDTYTEKPGYTWPADLAFSDADPGQYAALVIPGRPRARHLATTPNSARSSRSSFFDADKPVAQICHGPLLTAAADALSGRRAPRTRHWNWTCRPPERPSRTRRRWSTAPSCPPAPGRTTRPGTAPASLKVLRAKAPVG